MRPEPRRLRYSFESAHFRGILSDVLAEVYDISPALADETAAAVVENYARVSAARKGFADEDPALLAAMSEAARRETPFLRHDGRNRRLPHEHLESAPGRGGVGSRA